MKRRTYISLLLVLINFNLYSQSAQSPVPRKADSLYFNREYGMALKEYNEFIKGNTAVPAPTLARMAFCNHFLGHYNEAMNLYADVLKKQPGAPLKAQLYSRMAMTYSKKKDKQNAFTSLDSAVANGYLNTYELENFEDFKTLRDDARFKQIYNTVYNNAFPCHSQPGARLFDFWVGEWDVYNNQYPNQRVGTSIIQKVSGECLILENWQAYNNPFSGKSQNWYDTTTKKWTQLWIGSGGGTQYFTDGEYKDGAMRFKLQQPGANGTMQPGNFYFYNLGPDKVRQYQDLSNDGGKTFQPVYDFLYIRKK